MRPTGAALGADIEGVDLSRELAPETLDAIREAWADNLVLRFRGQHLDDDALMRFSAHFGELDRAPVIAAARVKAADGSEVESVEEGPRYVSVISNIIENGKAIGALGAYESIWHTDMSYNPHPPCASALYALEVPPAGGDTGFANMYRAYETMPDDLQRGSRAGSAATIRAATAPANCARHAGGDRPAAGAGRQPSARAHPSRHRPQGALPRPPAQRLYPRAGARRERTPARRPMGHATRPELAWYQQWRVGDLVMWDNRCTLHRRDEFDPSAGG